MLLMMVGRKTGRDEKAMLVQKNMNAVRYNFGSVKTVSASRHFKPGFFPVVEVEGSFSFRSRKRATFFSREVR